ncbi:MAG: hypothetical protein CVU78_04305 [Elusimicrobia bacterium HGW-Elusimicrobia-2]|nr:MAG: hypothetical protein CVU78_04305 [Elusimicrobia bacterium HGW-Elusimicrobia-2]
MSEEFCTMLRANWQRTAYVSGRLRVPAAMNKERRPNPKGEGKARARDVSAPDTSAVMNRHAPDER